MIQAISTNEQKQRFLQAAGREPALYALMARDLALWADNPGAPVKLFTAGDAALSITDDYAWLVGQPGDLEELASFLRFAGVNCLQTCENLPDTPGLTLRGQETVFVLAAGSRLPQPPLPEGFTPDRDVTVSEAADLLFPVQSGYRDGFYSRTSTAVNHGLARLWGLRSETGALVANMGADALVEGHAYLSLLHTDPAYRRRGLGGWLVTAMANALAADGWTCSFFCEPHNLDFYRNLGFVPRENSLNNYRVAQ